MIGFAPSTDMVIDCVIIREATLVTTTAYNRRKNFLDVRYWVRPHSGTLSTHHCQSLSIKSGHGNPTGWQWSTFQLPTSFGKNCLNSRGHLIPEEDDWFGRSRGTVDEAGVNVMCPHLSRKPRGVHVHCVRLLEFCPLKNHSSPWQTW